MSDVATFFWTTTVKKRKHKGKYFVFLLLLYNTKDLRPGALPMNHIFTGFWDKCATSTFYMNGLHTLLLLIIIVRTFVR